MSRRPLTDDLFLPEPDAVQTVQVGHSPLPFDEADCELPVRFAEIRMPMPRQESVETMMVPRRVRAETAPTVLLKAAEEPPPPEPSGLMEEAAAPAPDRSTTTTLMFFLILLAISLASVAAGVLIAPLVD